MSYLVRETCPCGSRVELTVGNRYTDAALSDWHRRHLPCITARASALAAAIPPDGPRHSTGGNPERVGGEVSRPLPLPSTSKSPATSTESEDRA